MSLLEILANDPALRSLIKAFNRWQKEEPYDQDRTHAQTLVRRALDLVLDSGEEIRIPEPAAFAFITSLQPLEPSELPAESGECQICVQAYRPLSDQAINIKICVAVRLPCNHIFGKWCILKWINPFDELNNNSCPCCRREFFSKFHDIDTIEGLQEQVDLVDWCAQNLTRVSSVREKRVIAGWTKSIVSICLQEGRQELYNDIRRRQFDNEGSYEEQLLSSQPNPSRSLMELQLREALMDGIGHQVRISDLREEIAADQAQLRVVNEYLRQNDQENAAREAEEDGDYDRGT